MAIAATSDNPLGVCGKLLTPPFPPSVVFHRFAGDLTAFDAGGYEWSNNFFTQQRANPTTQRDVVLRDLVSLAPQGTTRKRYADPPARPEGISLFVPFASSEALKFAHEKILGESPNILRTQQKKIDSLPPGQAKDDQQAKLNEEIANLLPCYTSSNPSEAGISGLFYDYEIKFDGEPVACHCMLFPYSTEAHPISLAEFNERAKCVLPDGSWTRCPYRFEARAEEVDLPNYPPGDVDAAILLLESVISHDGADVEDRFGAAIFQYLLASHSAELKEADAIVSLGDGFIAELFVKAGKIRKSFPVSVPEPFPLMSELVSLAHDYLGRISLHVNQRHDGMG